MRAKRKASGLGRVTEPITNRVAPSVLYQIRGCGSRIIRPMAENAGQACEMFALMKDDKLVMIVAKDPNRPFVTDITDELADLLRYRATTPRKLSLDSLCPDPVEPGWTMRQCFEAHRCSCARGVALGYKPTTQPIAE